MSVTFCTCCTFHTGAPSRSRDGMQLHHAFCPAWTMTDNYIYPSNQFPHNGKSKQAFPQSQPPPPPFSSAPPPSPLFL